MTLRSLLLIVAAAALPSVAAPVTAAPPAPAPYKLDAATLGRLDAILGLCAKADAENRATYDAFRTEMIVLGEGTPTELRVEGSERPEYKNARAETLEAAAKASRDEIVAQCRRMIGASTGKGH